MIKAKIKEIFTSIQGEGPYLGYKQLFIRFCGCNLACAYCDTDYYETGAVEYAPTTLASIINAKKNLHSVSLTGGEPLLHADFLTHLLPLVDHKIYLETNGTLTNELEKIARYIDIIAMDIKIYSSSSQNDLFETHEGFIKMAKKHRVETFLKIIFSDKITDEEIEKILKLAKENDLEIILQPQMQAQRCLTSAEEMLKTYDKFNSKYNKVRLIPQTHKFLGIE